MAENASDNTNCTADSTPDSTVCTADSISDSTNSTADNRPDSTICTADSTPDTTTCTADSISDTTTCTADSTPDTTTCTADSTPDSTICMADDNTNCPADDRQNNDIFDKISILELQKKYGIGRDSLYGRMRYLQITTYKIKGKAYLDAEQTAHMDGLHDHIQATGKMEGYPIPEPSGPVEEQAPQPTATQHEQATQHDQAPQHEQAPQPTVAITVSEPAQLTTEPEVIKGARQHDNSETEAIASLVRSAQNKAAGVLIAENMLAQQFIENPDSLPEELRAKIKQSSKMSEVDPFAYAKSLVNFANKSAAA